MVKSMTGFGRSRVSTPMGDVDIELTSVNRKTIDLLVFSPKEFARFEIPLRSLVNSKINRGQITLRINRDAISALPKAEALKRFKAHFDGLAKEMGMSESIDLPFLVQEIGRWGESHEIVDEEGVQKALENGLAKALEALMTMKKQEGSHLRSDIEKRCVEMEKTVSALEAEAKRMPKLYREKLECRLKELEMEPGEVIGREVAIYADKSDVSEEITRLRSHMKKLREAMDRESGVGRMCDFIVQELLREANTIGSKSITLEVKDHVLNLKGLIEQIREQVQNIE